MEKTTLELNLNRAIWIRDPVDTVIVKNKIALQGTGSVNLGGTAIDFPLAPELGEGIFV
jgi:hypothetical protein